MNPKSQTTRKQTSSKPPTLAEIADALEITVRRVSQLRLEGMPVSSAQDAQRWREARSGDDSVVELRRRRIGVLKQQERRARIEADQVENKLILRSEVAERDIVTASAVKAFLLKLENEIPFLCLGLPIEKAREVSKREIRKIWTAFAQGSEEFWNSHPEAKPTSKS
jgi:hypothetical protein